MPIYSSAAGRADLGNFHDDDASAPLNSIQTERSVIEENPTSQALHSAPALTGDVCHRRPSLQRQKEDGDIYAAKKDEGEGVVQRSDNNVEVRSGGLYSVEW